MRGTPAALKDRRVSFTLCLCTCCSLPQSPGPICPLDPHLHRTCGVVLSSLLLLCYRLDHFCRAGNGSPGRRAGPWAHGVHVRAHSHLRWVPCLPPHSPTTASSVPLVTSCRKDTVSQVSALGKWVTETGRAPACVVADAGTHGGSGSGTAVPGNFLLCPESRSQSLLRAPLSQRRKGRVPSPASTAFPSPFLPGLEQVAVREVPTSERQRPPPCPPCHSVSCSHLVCTRATPRSS